MRRGHSPAPPNSLERGGAGGTTSQASGVLMGGHEAGSLQRTEPRTCPLEVRPYLRKRRGAPVGCVTRSETGSHPSRLLAVSACPSMASPPCTHPLVPSLGLGADTLLVPLSSTPSWQGLSAWGPFCPELSAPYQRHSCFHFIRISAQRLPPSRALAAACQANRAT